MLARIASLLLLLLPFVSASLTRTSKFVTSADGTEIYADAVGDPSNPSIVFVHGFALSGIVWDSLFTNQKLLNTFYLVRYDMRGHGRSGKPDTADAHTSVRYAEDFTAVANGFRLNKPVFVGWSLAAIIITDIAANLNPIPIAGAVALDGSPGISADIVPSVASQTLIQVLTNFNVDNDVNVALDSRQQFIDALFKSPDKVSFSLKMTYMGQTVLQPPAISALVSMRPQNVTKLFEAGDKGALPLQVLFGTSDKLVIAQGVIDTFKSHFKNMTVNLIDGGHAVWEDNQQGMADALTAFALKVAPKRRYRDIRSRIANRSSSP